MTLEVKAFMEAFHKARELEVSSTITEPVGKVNLGSNRPPKLKPWGAFGLVFA